MFQPPIATVSLRVGAGAARAQGEIYNFFSSQLTLDRSDFRGFAYAADLSVRVAPRVDIGVGFAYDHSSTPSEFKDWTDQNDNPIEQTTELRRLPLSVNARYYLLSRGRSVAQHAWVPFRFTPYVTAGGGLMLYKLIQNGDWVNTQTLDIFSHRFESSGAGGMLNAGAGTEWWLTPTLGLTAEARYAWGSATLERDFDFDRIDLSGLQLTTGLAVRF
ncbi:MAG TPA: hypothetical protein VF021_03810 [Longimicrobiales bacterium]